MALQFKDLKLGECYVACGFNCQDWCFIHKYDDVPHIGLSEDFYSSNGWQFYQQANSIREATEEEKHWLNSCIKAGKFISKSDIIFPTKEKLKENKEWWKELKKGDFVVVIETSFGNNNRSYYQKDYIFEFDYYYNESCLYKEAKWVNLVGSTGNNGIITSNLRLATEQEIALYKAHGKPVHINTPFPEEKPLKAKEMTDEELLREAQRRYPIGTRYWNLNLIGDRSMPSAKIEDLPTIPEDVTFKIDRKTNNKEKGPIICVHSTKSTHGWVYSNGIWAEIVNSSKEMTKEELLVEAKIRYPIGTRFKNAYDNKGDRVVPNNPNYNNLTDKSVGINGVGWLMYDNKWAEIISLPEDTNKCTPWELVGPNESLWKTPTKDDHKYIVGIDPYESPKKTKNILLLGEFEPIIINEYKECSINNLI